MPRLDIHPQYQQLHQSHFIEQKQVIYSLLMVDFGKKTNLTNLLLKQNTVKVEVPVQHVVKMTDTGVHDTLPLLMIITTWW